MASILRRWLPVVVVVFCLSFRTTSASRDPATLPSPKDDGFLLRGAGEQRTSPPLPRRRPEIESDFDRSQSTGGAASGTTTWKPSGCISIPLNFTLCRGAGYSQMHLPNLLQHENLSQALEQAASWVRLLDSRCHPDIKIFLCSLLAPICHVRPIWPCQKLCRAVRGSCESVALNVGLPWPQDLACDRLPSDSRNVLCISDQKHQRSKGEKRCSACAQPDTLEGIVDHFCRVDTAMRLTVDRVTSSAPDVKVIGSKAKILKRRKTLTKEDLLKTPIVVDSGIHCSCPPLWNGSDAVDPTDNNGTQYLVMGTTARQGGQGRSRRLQVSFLRPFDASSRSTARALSAMQRDNLCTSGIRHLLLLQTTKNKRKTKKKENKAKTKKKEARQRQLRAQDRQKTPIANKTTTT